MGYIDDLPYGLEFFSLKNEEELLYQVTNIFEQANNLAITNSPLTPSLYEIPAYIEELMTYYESNDNELTAETKTYFLNYSKQNPEENEQEALSLIAAYQAWEVEEETSPDQDLTVFITLLFILISLSTIFFILIYRTLTKKIRQLYKKVTK